MQALLSFSRAIDKINEKVGKAAAWLILLAVLVSTINALIRYGFSMSSNAWLELQWYLFAGTFLLCAPWTLKCNEHIRIDIVYGAFSRRVQHWIDLLGHLFFLLPFVALMVWMMVPYAWAAFQSGQISTNAGGLIIWPARALLAAGASTRLTDREGNTPLALAKARGYSAMVSLLAQAGAR